MQTQNTERKSQNFFSLYFHCNLLSIPRFEFIVIGDWSQDSAGITHRHHIRRNIPHHYRSAADHDIRANRHARHNLHSRANPHIITHSDRIGILQPLVSALGIYGTSAITMRGYSKTCMSISLPLFELDRVFN